MSIAESPRNALDARSATQRSRPLLVGDIGGTHARFALVDSSGGAPQQTQVLHCANFAGPVAAAQAYLEQLPERVRPGRAALAVATAVTTGVIKLTNNDWELDCDEMAAVLDLSSVTVLNDFEALALSLPHLGPDDYRLIGSAQPDAGLPMAVIGPGTGLGVGGVIPLGSSPERWRAVASEGGHVTLHANDEFQAAVLAAARMQFAHVSAERLLSGIGLPTLRQAIATVQGLDAIEPLNSEQIGTRGSNGSDALCQATMSLFCSMLGSLAGNVALTMGARGGVFIGGGIVPKLGDFFDRSNFRSQFEAKGRFAEYLTPIATAVITAPFATLQGLSAAEV